MCNEAIKGVSFMCLWHAKINELWKETTVTSDCDKWINESKSTLIYYKLTNVYTGISRQKNISVVNVVPEKIVTNQKVDDTKNTPKAGVNQEQSVIYLAVKIKVLQI